MSKDSLKAALEPDWINADTCIENAEIAYEDSTEDEDGPVDTVISSGDLGVLIGLAKYATTLRTSTDAAAAGGKHPSHVTRSSDSSLYDEVCTACGVTDIAGCGWGELGKPCAALAALRASTDAAPVADVPWCFDMDKMHGVNEVAFDTGFGSAYIRVCERVILEPTLVNGFPVPRNQWKYGYRYDDKLTDTTGRAYAWRPVPVPPIPSAGQAALSYPAPAEPVGLREEEATKLADLIRTRLLGIDPDDQDLQLDDDDWRLILEALAQPPAAEPVGMREALKGVRAWVASLTVTDMNEIVADGGITAGMVVGQEAVEQLRRIDKAMDGRS